MIRQYCDWCDAEIFNKDTFFSLQANRSEGNSYSRLHVDIKVQEQYYNPLKALSAAMLCTECVIKLIEVYNSRKKS